MTEPSYIFRVVENGVLAGKLTAKAIDAIVETGTNMASVPMQPTQPVKITAQHVSKAAGEVVGKIVKAPTRKDVLDEITALDGPISSDIGRKFVQAFLRWAQGDVVKTDKLVDAWTTLNGTVKPAKPAKEKASKPVAVKKVAVAPAKKVVAKAAKKAVAKAPVKAVAKKVVAKAVKPATKKAVAVKKAVAKKTAKKA